LDLLTRGLCGVRGLLDLRRRPPRPSLLEASAEKRDGRVTGMWIGGRCVSMMQGLLEI
jgi:hypothetical protein